MHRSSGEEVNCRKVQLVLFLALSTMMALVTSICSRKPYMAIVRGRGWMGYRSRRTIPIWKRGLDGTGQCEGPPRELVGVEGGVFCCLC